MRVALKNCGGHLALDPLPELSGKLLGDTVAAAELRIDDRLAHPRGLRHLLHGQVRSVGSDPLHAAEDQARPVRCTLKIGTRWPSHSAA